MQHGTTDRADVSIAALDALVPCQTLASEQMLDGKLSRMQ